MVSGLGLAAAALVLAGCGSAGEHVVHVVAPPGSAPAPAPSAVGGGRYVEIVSMSGLEVAPPAAGSAAKHLGLTWGQAAALFESTSAVQGSHAHAILGYGLVTLAGSSLPAGTPPLDRRRAWVGITWGGATNCPAGGARPGRSSTSNGSPRQSFTAVVIYGEGGDGAIVYTSRGTPPCGGPPTEPTATAAKEVLAVPWRQVGQMHNGAVTVSYSSPACAMLFSTSASGDTHGGAFTLTVEVAVPLDRSGCKATADRATTVRLFPASTVPGAPAFSKQVKLAHGSIGPVAVLEAGRVAGAPS
ncbi:MAG: hypothetical protein ACYCV7_14430 [Acidimicrobiales bacterium]